MARARARARAEAYAKARARAKARAKARARGKARAIIKNVFDDKFVMGGRRTFMNFATQHFVYNCGETLPAHSQPYYY